MKQELTKLISQGNQILIALQDNREDFIITALGILDVMNTRKEHRNG